MVVFAYHVTPRSCAIHLGAAELDVVLQPTQPALRCELLLLRVFWVGWCCVTTVARTASRTCSYPKGRLGF